MTAKILTLLLLSCLAVFPAYPSYAEDMPPLEDYQPPPFMFDEAQPAAAASMPFLTLIEPGKKNEAKTSPLPPGKPLKPVLKKTSGKKIPVPAKTAVARPFSPPQKTGVKSKTQLEDGRRLVTPSVRDVLASIEGVKPSETASADKISLNFLPGESALTLDMKNILLRDFLPGLKDDQKLRAQIYAHAPAGSNTGETEARRLSLSRGLEVRDFLLAAGIDASRIDVMPLGNREELAPTDRVDILYSRPRR